MNQNVLFKRLLIGLVLGTWATGIGYGLHMIYAYSTQPGPPAEAPVHMPAVGALDTASNAPVLLMFVHPQCPCTKASLRELERLQAELRGTSLEVVVIVMTGEDPALRLDAGLGRVAQVMQAVRVVGDAGGQLARRFGARTSGQTLLYDAAGELRFAGGITPSRGHEGSNRGRRLIRQILNEGAQPEDTFTPVFGCVLQGEGDGATLDGRARETWEAESCCKP